MINFDDKKSKERHWVSLFIYINTAVSFYSFVIEQILQEVLNKMKDKSITHDIFRIQNHDSIICRHMHRINACRKNFVSLY